MTRPKADSDPWLTDPVSRDREIAKTVVYGMRTIISLLRNMRDEQADEMRVLRAELNKVRQEQVDLWEHMARTVGPAAARADDVMRRGQHDDYPRCENRQCSLPLGHEGNHRGSIRVRQ